MARAQTTRRGCDGADLLFMPLSRCPGGAMRSRHFSGFRQTRLCALECKKGPKKILGPKVLIKLHYNAGNQFAQKACVIQQAFCNVLVAAHGLVAGRCFAFVGPVVRSVHLPSRRFLDVHQHRCHDPWQRRPARGSAMFGRDHVPGGRQEMC